jgi:hypothetical protein
LNSHIQSLLQDNLALETKLRDLKSASKQQTDTYQGDLKKLLSTVQEEVERKYHGELRVLVTQVKELRERVRDEMVKKEKEVK